jgi:hypothetical protein
MKMLAKHIAAAQALRCAAGQTGDQLDASSTDRPAKAGRYYPVIGLLAGPIRVKVTLCCAAASAGGHARITGNPA